MLATTWALKMIINIKFMGKKLKIYVSNVFISWILNICVSTFLYAKKGKFESTLKVTASLQMILAYSVQ